MTDQNDQTKESEIEPEEIRSFEDTAPDVLKRLVKEQEIAASISGQFSNRFFVFVSDDFVKISFLEVPSSKSHAINPQSSAVLTIKDARELHKLLGTMLRPEHSGNIGTST